MVNSGIITTTISPVTSGTSMDSSGVAVVPADQYRSALDLKKFSQNEGFERFYNVMSYSKAKQVPWRLCDDAMFGVGFIGQPNSRTCFLCTTTGWPNGFIMGEFDVTFYIKFRYRMPA